MSNNICVSVLQTALYSLANNRLRHKARIKASVGSVASYAARYRTRQLRPIFPLVSK